MIINNRNEILKSKVNNKEISLINKEIYLSKEKYES
jgi:hypothetical protein